MDFLCHLFIAIPRKIDKFVKFLYSVHSTLHKNTAKVQTFDIDQL